MLPTDSAPGAALRADRILRRLASPAGIGGLRWWGLCGVAVAAVCVLWLLLQGSSSSPHVPLRAEWRHSEERRSPPRRWFVKDALEVIAFSPDERRLVTVGERRARWWDISVTPPRPDTGVYRAQYAIMNLATWKFLRTGPPPVTTETVPGAFTTVCAATATAWQDVLIGWRATVDERRQLVAVYWDPATGQEQRMVRGRIGDASPPVICASDGSAAAVFDRPGSAAVWRTDTERESRLDVTGEESSAVKGITVLPTYLRARLGPGGKLLAVWDGEYVTIMDTGTTRTIARLPVPGTPSQVAFSRDGRTLAMGASGGGITLWDTATGRPRLVLNGPKNSDHPANRVTALAFAPSGTVLASGHADGMVRLWNIGS